MDGPLIEMSQPHHTSLSTSNYLLEMIFVRLRKKMWVTYMAVTYLIWRHCWVPACIAFLKKNEITILNNIIIK